MASPDPDCAGQRAILTLAQGTDGARAEFVGDLSRGAGVTVSYMRHLFADYYLYCLATDDSGETLDGVVERLAAQPGVLQVEIDRIHTLQETP
jgi:hypothetical protein